MLTDAERKMLIWMFSEDREQPPITPAGWLWIAYLSGFVALVEGAVAADCVRSLHAAGYDDAAVVGRVKTARETGKGP